MDTFKVIQGKKDRNDPSESTFDSLLDSFWVELGYQREVINQLKESNMALAEQCRLADREAHKHHHRTIRSRNYRFKIFASFAAGVLSSIILTVYL